MIRTTTANDNPNASVVKSGDTLSKTAKAPGTTIKALRVANALKTDAIVVGQKLKLTEPKTGGRRAVETLPSHP